MLLSLVKLTDTSINYLDAHEVPFIEVKSTTNLSKIQFQYSLLCADKSYSDLPWEYMKDHIKSIFITTAGVNHFPWQKTNYETTPLITSKGLICQSVAEYVLACILASTTKIMSNKRLQKRKHWEAYQSINVLKDKKILILGAGYIAKRINTLLQALGHKAILVNSDDDVPKLNLSDIDVLIDILPATRQTYKIINEDLINRLKNGVVLVLAGRGQNYDSQAILESVRKGKIAEVFADVFDEEPLPTASDFWTEENIHVSPHSSGRHVNNTEKVQIGLIERYLKGQQGESLQRYTLQPHKGY